MGFHVGRVKEEKGEGMGEDERETERETSPFLPFHRRFPFFYSLIRSFAWVEKLRENRGVERDKRIRRKRRENKGRKKDRKD